jgi:hypothetical protein
MTMPMETKPEILELVTQTRHLMHQADEVLRRAHRIGFIGLKEMLEPMQRLHAVLKDEAPELERLLMERLD